MLRVRRENLTKDPRALIAAGLALVILIYLAIRSSSVPSTTVSSSSATIVEGKGAETALYVARDHAPERLVPASAFSGPLKKPLELGENEASVVCPERGGKNAPCSKSKAEYRFLIKESNEYYLYVEVIAPDLNANSLWVGVDQDFESFSKCDDAALAGPLTPHKHVTSSGKWLCCPAYLGKNKKKGLAAFYSDCCYNGLGKGGDESGCVLDLEVDTQPKWNQLPRVIKVDVDDPKQGKVITVRLYAREDGTAWTRLALSRKADMAEKNVRLLKPSPA